MVIWVLQETKLWVKSMFSNHWSAPSISYLSGEQVELFPVETLVSMLSELSRLSVSYAGPPAGGAGWCRIEWCTTGAARAGNGPFNWEWETCGTPQWSISSLGFSSLVRNRGSSHVWNPRQMHKETNMKSGKRITLGNLGNPLCLFKAFIKYFSQRCYTISSLNLI